MHSKHLLSLVGIGIAGIVVGLVFGRLVLREQPPLPEQTDVVEEMGEPKEQLEDVEGEEEMEYVFFDRMQYAVLSRHAFDEQDPTREVLHLCRPDRVMGVYVGVFGTDEFTQPQQLVCAYDTAETIVLVENGEMRVLNVISSKGHSTEAFVKDVRLINDETLLIAFEPDACDLFALCIDMFDRLFLIDLASHEVQSFEGVGTIVDLEMVDFNPDLTKYVTLLGCPEGCPNEIIEGYDLVKQEKKSFSDVIVRGDSYEWGADVQTDHRVQENYWKDNNTFHLVVRRHVGDEVEVKELDLTF